MSEDLTDDKSILVQVWLGATRKQAITWTDVDSDPCRHMASLGRNEFVPFDGIVALFTLGPFSEQINWY